MDICISRDRRTAIVKAELFDPGDGIDMSLIENIALKVA
jgi:hypothetical protein